MARGSFSAETRYFTGHGSLLRGDAIALPHVGYWMMERFEGRAWTTSGQLRGNAQILRWLSSAEHTLLLVFEDGRRLPIVLMKSHADALTWEFQVTKNSHWVTATDRAKRHP